MDTDMHEIVAHEQSRVFVDATNDSISTIERDDPAIDDESEEAVATDDVDQSSSASTDAMVEFLPLSSEQVEHDAFLVLVVLQPDSLRHRVMVTAQTTVAKLRQLLCTDLQLAPESVTFPDFCRLRDNENNVLLSSLGIQAECTIEAFVAKAPISNDYIMPERLQVQVYNEETKCTTWITVNIEKFVGRKVYLGGYKHRKTLQLYHHASTQTDILEPRGPHGPLRYHRDTQTQILVTCSIQTKRESGTQMSRRDLKLDEAFDYQITAHPYFDSYQFESLREDSVLVIQRMWRGYRARDLVFSMLEQRRRSKEIKTLTSLDAQAAEKSRKERQVTRRMHPNSVNDFESLYNELATWRQHECQKVRAQTHLDQSDKQRAIDGILKKETKLLQTIDRLKVTATEGNRNQQIESMMQFMARPKLWQLSDGGIQNVHTPFTIRAKELMDLYHGLRTPLHSVDERLDMLLHIKWTVQEFDCPLTREIIELIDREADMLHRGRKEKSFEGLRKRLTNLFLQFLETPEFNPEATALKPART
ncbi:putative IQ and ubiquitin-like domain-containing protein [Plasmopara halstedii]